MSGRNGKPAGMKEREIIDLGPCPICGKKAFEAGDLTYYVIEISRTIVDATAIQRRHGLGMMLGNEAIARALGPDEDLMKVMDGPHRVIVHETCAADVGHLLRLIPEDTVGVEP